LGFRGPTPQTLNPNLYTLNPNLYIETPIHEPNPTRKSSEEHPLLLALLCECLPLEFMV